MKKEHERHKLSKEICLFQGFDTFFVYWRDRLEPWAYKG